MSSKGIKIVQSLFGKQIRKATNDTLNMLTDTEGKNQHRIEKHLQNLNSGYGDSFLLGQSSWGYPVSVPLSLLIKHALVVGSTGTGKSYLALLLLMHSLENFRSGKYIPMAILDAKGELAAKAIEYIQAFIYQFRDEDRECLQRKVVVMDFAQTDKIMPYNILDCSNMPAELLVNTRIQTINQIYRGTSALTARMRSILKYMMLLMIEHKLPITLFEKLCLDAKLVQKLAVKSKDERLRHYFTTRFPKEARSTVLGLAQRIDSLFVSEGVKLSMSARSAPDFQKLQDEGYFIIINVCGPHISRSTSEFLLRIILSDIQQSVFRRKKTDIDYLWCLDEAQVLYRDQISRENMNDLLTMSRSFGSYFMLLTQSLTSAVRDSDIINSILQNIRWTMMFRSTLRDAKIIAPAIPITGMRGDATLFPFGQQKFLTKEQELKCRLEEITHFPEQIGYLWLRSEVPHAIKMKTRRLPSPEQIAGCSQKKFAAFISENSFGNLLPRCQVENELHKVVSRIKDTVIDDSDKPATENPTIDDADDMVKILESAYLQKTGLKQKP